MIIDPRNAGRFVMRCGRHIVAPTAVPYGVAMATALAASDAMRASNAAPHGHVAIGPGDELMRCGDGVTSPVAGARMSPLHR